MLFASQSSGDAIAASFRPTLDREDAFFDDPGGRSGNRVASGADQAVFLKERRDAVIELGPDCPAPSSERRSQCAAVDWGSRHDEPVRLSSKPNPWGCRIAAVTSRVIDLAIEGLALSAVALHPEFFLPLAERGPRRDLGKDRPDGPGADSQKCAGSARSAVSVRPGGRLTIER